jgi:hypothetical protein
MGLNISHDCWEGSYTSFNEFRVKLGLLAGYQPDDDDYVIIDWTNLTKKEFGGRWNKTPKDPLLVLLAHYDCEGKIYRNQQMPLSNRLKELLAIAKNRKEPKRLLNWVAKFIAGLECAYKKKEIIEFG